jgi:hypothetical protein
MRRTTSLSEEVVAAVVDMKQRNPTWGPRIAQQITLAFGIPGPLGPGFVGPLDEKSL